MTQTATETIAGPFAVGDRLEWIAPVAAHRCEGVLTVAALAYSDRLSLQLVRLRDEGGGLSWENEATLRKDARRVDNVS